MKKYFLLMVSMFAISLSTFAVDVPKAVADAFAKKFPAATQVKWGKENKNEYEAEFKINGKSASANFLTDGSWVETEMEIGVTELPAGVASTVKTKYPGASIVKAYKIETAKGGITYETEIKTGSKKQELNMKADGSIVK